MLAAERLARIVDITNQREIVTIDELMEATGGSRATIRRDVGKLCDNGLVRKTHGGVMSIAMGAAAEPPLRVKSGLHTEEKRRIARRALELIHENEHVILDSGTTVLELAKLLDDKKHFTAVTYDLLAAMEVAKHPAIDLLMLGGVLRKTYYSFFGYFAEDMLKHIAADKAFVSVDAVDLRQGLMNYTTDDIAVKKLIVESSREVILLCDHSKFAARSFIRICELSRVSRIITGAEIDADILAKLRDMGMAVETV